MSFHIFFVRLLLGGASWGGEGDGKTRIPATWGIAIPAYGPENVYLLSHQLRGTRPHSPIDRPLFHIRHLAYILPKLNKVHLS